MQHSRFVVLTGHLNDYPLSDLVGILRHQQKTGRLMIEYPNSPASFFFNEGELVDAQLEKLSGLQAVCVALAQPPASFNFNPLIRPTRRSIENSMQKVVSELVGCWNENELEVDTIPLREPLPQPPLLVSPTASLPEASQTLEKDRAVLALPPAPPVPYNRAILAMASAGLLLLGLSTIIAVTGRFGKQALSASAPTSLPQTSNDGSLAKSTEGLAQNVAKTELGNNSRTRRTLAHSTRQESRNPSSKQDKRDAEGNGVVSTAKPDTKAHEKPANETAAEGQSVKVVLKIEGGRVAQASIANPRSGMEAYEALALRIARQRRYQSKGATQEMVTIKLSPPK